MQVLPQCGHAVHEDVPEKVADVIAAFITRHKFAEATDKFHKWVEEAVSKICRKRGRVKMGGIVCEFEQFCNGCMWYQSINDMANKHVSYS